MKTVKRIHVTVFAGHLLSHLLICNKKNHKSFFYQKLSEYDLANKDSEKLWYYKEMQEVKKF